MFSYVKLEGDPRGAPPAHPGSGWKDRYSARQRIGGLILAYARAAGQVLHSNGHPPLSELLFPNEYVTRWNLSGSWGGSCVLASATDTLGTSLAVRLAPYRERGPIKEPQQDLRDTKHTAAAVYIEGILPCTALLLHTGAGFLHDSLAEQAGSQLTCAPAVPCCSISLLPSQRDRSLPCSTVLARASTPSDILLLCFDKTTLHDMHCVLEQAVRPHLGAIAAKMEEMWSASQLSVSERINPLWTLWCCFLPFESITLHHMHCAGAGGEAASGGHRGQDGGDVERVAALRQRAQRPVRLHAGSCRLRGPSAALAGAPPEGSLKACCNWVLGRKGVRELSK